MTAVSIILLILKIIGIVLASLLGIILILLLAILFLPIKYRVIANKNTVENTLTARANISYLLHLYNFRAIYEEGKLSTRHRICIFNINLNKKADKNKKSKKKNKKDNSFSDKKPIKKDECIADTVQRENMADESESISSSNFEMFTYEDFEKTSDVSTTEITNNDMPEDDSPYDDDGESDNDKPQLDEEDEDTSLFNKIVHFVSVVFDFCKRIREKIKKIFYKFADIYNNVEYYTQFISNPKVQDEIAKLLGIVSKLLKRIKPTKFNADINIGMSDPASTGQALAILAIFYPVLHDHVNVVPYFEEEILDFDIIIKGKILVFDVLIAAFKIYFDKDLKKIRSHLKNKEAL